MTEPTITCPKCQTEIKLTESLAAPLIESTRRECEQRLADKEADVRQREAAVAKAHHDIDAQIAEKLKTERQSIATAEAKRAREALADEINKTQQERAATEELLKQRDAKLAETQKNELELRRDRQRLQEEKEQFELEKQRAIDAERTKIREAAQKDADERSRLRLAERDKTISDLQVKLQDALHKTEQGSQQLQGEVQEMELEAILCERFPRDTIIPVPKGEYGGDVLHRVFGPLGQACGTILWESKRTKSWSDVWMEKLRDDQRAANAEFAVLVTQALPKGVETFDLYSGVWVTCTKTLVPVAIVLRHALVELAAARRAGDGQQTKMEMIYQYLTGPRFRHRVKAIVDKFSIMQHDLEKERRTMTRLWKKREEQLRAVVDSTAGMYGDLQGIAGQSLKEIDGLDIKLLTDGQTDESDPEAALTSGRPR